MDWLRRKRLFQVIKYGWSDAKKIARETRNFRLYEYYLLLKSFNKYYVFSNQYFGKKLYALSPEDKETIADKIGKKNIQRDNWIVDKYNNRRFIEKWSSLKWETSPELSLKQNQAYMKQFNAGEGLCVQRNVDIHREHFLEGTIRIGKNVLLAKNVFIDYSGEVILEDNVKISASVTIESHRHEFFPETKEKKAIQTHILIEEGGWIGQHSIICEDCKRIGRFAQIGAGAVVRNPIPPYAIVVGNPAKIVGFLYTPEEVVEFEKDRYSEAERTDIEKYTKLYEKYFINRMSEIKKSLSN
jgi:acetyltransferase-like isoleucine patch superfamily enzyme